MSISGCSQQESEAVEVIEEPVEVVEEVVEEEVKHASVLYQGHASMRVTTPEDKVIYIDPYMGDGYEEAADLILITHDHYDHVGTDLIVNKSDDCQIIRWNDMLVDGTYQSVDVMDVHVEAVEAGNNPNHPLNSGVGYVLTFSDGIKLYISGDTSTTEKMDTLEGIDYMFISCDGIYNMNTEEAIECANKVNAKHSIPYHTKPDALYDESIALSFVCDSAMYVKPGEVIALD
ncbi:MAG: MBL fold metallo-hydrolase [Erysipelotrichaceae bacterium]|nr:MBL fold metallo-hydrolase [Erysipelotrichaceae bacterium]